MNTVMNLLFDSGKDYDKYIEMHFLSTESIIKNIKADKLLTITDNNPNPFEVFRKFFHQTIEQVKKGNNVLVVEIDAIVVKPTKIFGEFDKMMMFTRTHPYSIDYQGVAGGWRFDPYMNSGIRYFPASIPRQILEKAENLIDIYDESFWGYDQVIYNWIYYQQHETADMRFQKYNYMPFKEFIQDTNEEEAHIIHLFSSRSPEVCLERMKKYYERIL